MKSCLLKFLFSYLVFILFSCSDPVFYTIHKEVAPIKPLIPGSPTGFAVLNGKMYVASGSNLFCYTGKSGTTEYKWEIGPNPGGRIIRLAAVGNNLYAVCNQGSGNNTVLRQCDISASVPAWTTIGTGLLNGSIGPIFSANNTLFVGGKEGDTYPIFYVISTSIYRLTNAAGKLTGAVWNGSNYFLSTDKGIFHTNNLSGGATLVSGSEGIYFTGIINLGGTIAAVTRYGGEIYTVSTASAGNPVSGVSMGKHMSTGALAIWQEPGENSKRLLLVGRQDELIPSVSSGYTYGYLELELASNGIENGAVYTEPGLGTPSSIKDGDNERYKSTIGKYPVNHIFQAPSGVDNDMTLFASTQQNGVFSYRNRDPWQWNAEK